MANNVEEEKKSDDTNLLDADVNEMIDDAKMIQTGYVLDNRSIVAQKKMELLNAGR